MIFAICIIISVLVLWDRLPTETVDALSLEVFNAKLDMTLRNLVSWKVSLCMAEELELDGLKGAFQPKTLYVLWKLLPSIAQISLVLTV